MRKEEDGVKIMTKKEKAELLEKGEPHCLGFIEWAFEGFIQRGDFESAHDWTQKFVGALMMLDSLGLISSDEYQARKEEMWERYIQGKYQNTCQEENA